MLCNKCSGKGFIDEKECPKCNGKSYAETTDKDVADAAFKLAEQIILNKNYADKEMWAICQVCKRHPRWDEIIKEKNEKK